eukprot:CAMPEP_0182883630 /NCGR_PEP_ID=MMETSP0034_2-20130328/18492_1 /TAXON_ID=156128 /ORGANISM="Nephroselmis pyriformis, Strain CCMP717" /LENGTH=131 /DNA_ID=CAMNT_0025016773 /DNA_START=145 /DNA_END=542 /DNA_ORIENTATION=+
MKNIGTPRAEVARAALMEAVSSFMSSAASPAPLAPASAPPPAAPGSPSRPPPSPAAPSASAAPSAVLVARIERAPLDLVGEHCIRLGQLHKRLFGPPAFIRVPFFGEAQEGLADLLLGCVAGHLQDLVPVD